MEPSDEKATNVPPPGAALFRNRVNGILLAAPCVTMLAIAWSLEPCKSGFGTAGQLGIPACSMLVNTRWPCPTCGMTTSVAAAARGDLPASWRAHPFGPVLTLAAVVLGVASLAQATTARPVLAALRVRWWWLIAALVGMFAGWGVVLALGAANGTLPMR